MIDKEKCGGYVGAAGQNFPSKKDQDNKAASNVQVIKQSMRLKCVGWG
jgi:hypothetical protein